MKRRKYTKSRRQVVAKHYLKSTLSGYPCFNKTVYPNENEAEKGATIMWGKDTRVDRRDVHGYECPDGCKFEGKKAWHIGHISYYVKFVERRQEIMESVNAQLSSM